MIFTAEMGKGEQMSEFIAFIGGCVLILLTWYTSSNDDKRQYRIGYQDGFEDGLELKHKMNLFEYAKDNDCTIEEAEKALRREKRNE